MTAGTGFDRLAVLVHEVRSPVAALAAIAAAYPDDSLDAPERRSLAELATAASRGIERIVTDATVSSIRLEDVDVGLLVREATLAGSLLGSNVTAVVADGVPRVQADPIRLRQAVDNLVSNALAHAPGEEVVVAVEPGEGVVRISVSDHGPGIPEADHARIFDVGVQLGDRVGSGLGLAVARAIALAHGGTLTVDSATGEGATFTLVLPVPEVL